MFWMECAHLLLEQELNCTYDNRIETMCWLGACWDGVQVPICCWNRNYNDEIGGKIQTMYLLRV